MASEIQNSGEAHFDAGDSEGRLSCMIGCPDVPESYEPGRFHPIETPFYIPLLNGSDPTISLFSGLRRHGGTPPLAPPGETPEVWALRGNMIDYPPMVMNSGSAHFDVAPTIIPSTVGEKGEEKEKPAPNTVRFTSDEVDLR